MRAHAFILVDSNGIFFELRLPSSGEIRWCCTVLFSRTVYKIFTNYQISVSFLNSINWTAEQKTMTRNTRNNKAYNKRSPVSPELGIYYIYITPKLTQIRGLTLIDTFLLFLDPPFVENFTWRFFHILLGGIKCWHPTCVFLYGVIPWRINVSQDVLQLQFIRDLFFFFK